VRTVSTKSSLSTRDHDAMIVSSGVQASSSPVHSYVGRRWLVSSHSGYSGAAPLAQRFADHIERLFWLRRLGSLHERLVGRARCKKRQQGGAGGSHHCSRTTIARPVMDESVGRGWSLRKRHVRRAGGEPHSQIPRPSTEHGVQRLTPGSY
jgi:hypothetical protein